MSDDNKKSLSQEMESIGGPVEEIDGLQTDLCAVLEGILERRNAIKQNMDEKEIKHILDLFMSASRRSITQRLLDSYAYNRYTKIKAITPTYVPVIAPRNSSTYAIRPPITETKSFEKKAIK
jgi:ATP-dependent helicase/DNAse subunit B